MLHALPFTTFSEAAALGLEAYVYCPTFDRALAANPSSLSLGYTASLPSATSTRAARHGQHDRAPLRGSADKRQCWRQWTPISFIPATTKARLSAFGGAQDQQSARAHHARNPSLSARSLGYGPQYKIRSSTHICSQGAFPAHRALHWVSYTRPPSVTQRAATSFIEN
jgi:hypothetical protein